MYLDPRSLALFRAALGCLVLTSTLQLAPDYAAFFAWGPHPQLIWQLLHLVLPVFSVLLILGCFSRVCALVCWLGIVAVQGANPALLDGGDRLLLVLLYWSIFLPLGAVWSIEAAFAKRPAPALAETSRWASWAITLQICLVYWSAAYAKSDPVWTQSHNALFYALSIEYTTSPLGMYLRHFPELLRWMTVATLSFEYLAPLLLFVPFQRDRFRMLAVVLFLTFHLIFMQALLRLGLFPWVCAAAWLIFLPGFFWEALTRPIASQRSSTQPTGWIRLLDQGLTCLVFVSIADMLVWNVVTVRDTSADDWLKKRDPTAGILHLNQHWRMYAPFPLLDHGWLVIPADLADGNQVDLFTGHPISWATPADIGTYLGAYRWRVYIADLYTNQDPERLRHYGDYLTDQWNEAHPDNRIKALSIVFMKMSTQPNLTVTGPERVTLYTRKY